ncbi:hypothetical protein IWQ61_008924 [Dispira simplex]|nr:hypothetical protein IWQ61_008924 [Dispira simplex]
MNSTLIHYRALGAIQPQFFRTYQQNHRLATLELVASKQILHACIPSTQEENEQSDLGSSSWVASLAIEAVDSRYLLVGSGNGSIQLYDLEETKGEVPALTPINARSSGCQVLTPLGDIPNTVSHRYTVADIHWYPMDTGLFTSSSYDTTVKVWDTNTLQTACTFSLDYKVFSHTHSPLGIHSLVAATTSDPLVRLCDLRTGAFSHTLAGHNSQVICSQWSPRDPYQLCTGGADGTVRLWDVRRAAACLRTLDQHNQANDDPLASTHVAHNASVNGLSFTQDGYQLATVGSDRRIRLWDATTGKHLLVNYGTKVPCSRLRKYDVVIPPLADCWPTPVFIPFSKTHEVTGWDLQSGQLLYRLQGAFRPVVCAAWRNGHEELYAGGYDQEILVWGPESHGDKVLEEEQALADDWSDID